MGQRSRPHLMPMHPDADTPAARQGMAKLVSRHDTLRQAGLDDPQPFDMRGWIARSPRMLPSASGAPNVRQFNLLTILVAFEDNHFKVPAPFFDGLIYGNRGIKPSVRDWYADNSADQFLIGTPKLPSQVGWQRLPQTYAYYVNGQAGMGSFPRNTQGMARDAVIQLVRSGFDFRPFANGTGQVEGLTLVHPGPGRELTTDMDHVHSHSWAFPPVEVAPGLTASRYTIQPEYWRKTLPLGPVETASDMTIGVFGHEFGHMFGLPDWYSVTNDGFGTGKWDPMASGSWNGGLGQCPPYFSPWGMMRLGFAEPSIVRQSGSYTISGPRQFLWIPITAGDPRIGYAVVMRSQSDPWDKFLPTSGVLIFKVDGRLNGNQHAWYPGRDPAKHYEVAVCEADNDYSLARGASSGEPDDAWPIKPAAEWIRDFADPDFYGSTVPFTLKVWESMDQRSATIDVQFKTFAIPGDINNDGALTAEDAVGVIMETYFGAAPSGRADVDLSGFVDATDVQVIIDKLSDAERARVPALLATALGG